MKTIGWAAIIYNVHDLLTFSAVLVLIAGECLITYITHRKPSRASRQPSPSPHRPGS
jgi:hypothetical protein